LQLDVVRDIKEKLCYVPVKGKGNDVPGEDEYELPDGTTITLNSQCRSQAAELLFTPEAGGEVFSSRAVDGGVASMVMQSISMCDKDINPDLLGSVVLAGGSTMMPGFAERVKDELDVLVGREGAQSANVIPHPTSHEPGYNAQRKHAAWIGGSIFASLSTFKQV
ncbi:unnamed protein product, partial [Choristocarpus tenellus]